MVGNSSGKVERTADIITSLRLSVFCILFLARPLRSLPDLVVRDDIGGFGARVLVARDKLEGKGKIKYRSLINSNKTIRS